MDDDDDVTTKTAATGGAAKPESKLSCGRARRGLVMVVTGALCILLYVSGGDRRALTAEESTSGPRPSVAAVDVLGQAAKKALNGGVAGFAAGVAQVFLFMWMRTVMNFQYAHGGTAANAFRRLYAEGGVTRFYRGVSFAVVQAPLARFGDAAFNAGTSALCDEWAPGVPAFLVAAAAAGLGAGWRIFISPVDTLKTALQVNGDGAIAVLTARVRDAGIAELYAGALANFGANWVGAYPWFAVYNTLQTSVPRAQGLIGKYARHGVIGVAACCVSDVSSNSLRVIKTVKQAGGGAGETYGEVARRVVAEDGVRGLFSRGLATRLATNAAQGMTFSVLWKALEERLNAEARDMT